jgi:hypothetical protein
MGGPLSSTQVPNSRLLIPIVESIPAVKGCRAVRANAQVSCTLIERLLHGHIGLGCAGEASRQNCALRRGVTRKALSMALGR